MNLRNNPLKFFRRNPKRNFRKPTKSPMYLGRVKARDNEYKMKVLKDYLAYLYYTKQLREIQSDINMLEQDHVVSEPMLALDFSKMKVSDTGLAAPSHDVDLVLMKQDHVVVDEAMIAFDFSRMNVSDTGLSAPNL
ncbi:uncharacterized protein LOC125496257 [Beta vulgaris subsp. vulgaris]|uniref:uncharacterized protein LOC125496257 n=1 Tax=Beta vulgaris subsp. vulgaris TaxID=3555 RepID=UPI002036B31C|nr:uncharacterized protein LOC125496257 [Beta vulgaris subsp. vulgaris]